MVTALHWDGLVLLCASIAMAFIGHDYRNWMYRIPVFCLGFCDFALAINLLGLYRPTAFPPWFAWRLIADGATLVITMVYFVRRPRHAAHT